MIADRMTPLLRYEQRKCAVCCGQAHFGYQVWTRTHYLCSERCYDILHRAQVQLRDARHKAREIGLAEYLPLSEWLHAIRYFSMQCAYCQDAPYESCDHYIPLFYGGGTTIGNCVPSCKACNASKERFYGEMLIALFGSEAYARIQIFLADRARREQFLIESGQFYR